MKTTIRKINEENEKKAFEEAKLEEEKKLNEARDNTDSGIDAFAKIARDEAEENTENNDSTEDKNNE